MSVKWVIVNNEPTLATIRYIKDDNYMMVIDDEYLEMFSANQVYDSLNDLVEAQLSHWLDIAHNISAIELFKYAKECLK